jgi:hypothetical protein
MDILSLIFTSSHSMTAFLFCRGAGNPLMPTQIPIKWILEDARNFSVFNEPTRETNQSHPYSDDLLLLFKGRE